MAAKPPQQSRSRSATFPTWSRTERRREARVNFDDYFPPILYHDIIMVSGNNIFGTPMAPQLSDVPELCGCARFPRVDVNGKVFGAYFNASPGELSHHRPDESFDVKISAHVSYRAPKETRSNTDRDTSPASIQSSPEPEKRPADEPQLSPRKKRLCKRSKADYEKFFLLR